ncbi:phosphatase PAP2 family protein [Edaphobacter sp. HDX4]|uniref:phosphatase PAP2 family protein n=1 Tax=Edaphobacter sp. HDX4 TaxID=2794064 RepID=UPI002FE6BEE5
MKHSGFAGGTAIAVCLACAWLHAQDAKEAPAVTPVKVRVASFIEVDRLSLATVIAPPPAAGSSAAKAELEDLHRIQDSRTAQQVKAAQADDAEEDIFIYRTALGSGFNAQALAATAAPSKQVHGDEPVASDVLKEMYQRPRPYQVDTTLHPVCKLTTKHNSYPSGHTLSGYLLALTLVEMVPEKRAEILERADDYAHNRLVCGVHTASDLEASRRIAYLMFGTMLENPRFQQELAAARAETRQALQMNR